MTAIHRLSIIKKSLLLLVGAMVLMALLAACATGESTQTAPTGATAFHRALKTTDGRFVVQFSVTPDRLGLNVFTVGVQDASSGKPVSNLRVQLTTMMLDMDMGTDQVALSPKGPGQYSAQGTLSMNGHWEIRILLHTSDAAVHQASVELDTLT